MRYFAIDGFDRKSEVWIFLERTPEKKIRVRPEYAKLVCTACGRIDELRILKRGLKGSVHLPTALPDYVSTNDWQKMVSRRMKTALESIDGVQVTFVPIPGTTKYWIIVPKKLIAPSDRRYKKYFQITKGACKKCGIVQAATWQENNFPIVRDKLIGAIAYIGRRTSLTLICSEEVKMALKKAKVTGWRTTEMNLVE